MTNPNQNQSLLINPDGLVQAISLVPDSEGSVLSQLYSHIGCELVDVVRLTDRVDMWIDDNGLYTKPLNPVATLVAQRFGRIHQPYFGPALLAGFTPDGDTVNLEREMVIAILAALEDVAAA